MRSILLTGSYHRSRRKSVVREHPFFLILVFIFYATPVAGAGEFTGIYRVGKTRCSVKPVKMAYEVQWVKGTGPMIFFFNRETSDGRYHFISENGRKARDRFVFDDSSFVSGTFIRADGRRFVLRKACVQPSNQQSQGGTVP